MPRPFNVLTALATFTAAVACMAVGSQPALSAPTCPISDGMTDAAKSNKLFVYFPTVADATFPAYATAVSPAKPFDVAGLNPAIGTTAALRNRIYDVVADDYCEFNVQALSTTTNPATLPSPPARRTTVAVGSDTPPSGAWGRARDVDIGDAVDVDFARVWAGSYTTCEGATPLGCTMTGSLTGANATLERWAQAIGGTAAHEAGHVYGLQHANDNPPSDIDEPGPPPTPGEDSFHRHLMPSGRQLSGPDRATYRRHFSDRTFGLLASNVGLSVQTMHNWDLVNPNAAAGRKLRIDFLSPKSSAPPISWTYKGSKSPWINPVVSGPTGNGTFKGKSYKRYRITWSTGNPAWSGTAGVVPGGAKFHVGATFTGVDFNAPDPIIVQNVTLLDQNSNPLTLHPRLPAYDAGTVDSSDGTFNLNMAAPPGGPNLVLENATIHQLPRVASIDSLIGAGRPATFDREPIRPWSTSRCDIRRIASVRGTTAKCTIAKVGAKPHVQVTHKLGEPNVVDCSKGVPAGQPGDSPTAPDYEGPICAGSQRDLFPSTTVYIKATVVDPDARHWDPRRRRYVTGPVRTKVFYQFAGRRIVKRG